MDLSALALPTDDPVLVLAVDPGLEAGHRLPVNGADPVWRAAFGADCVPARRLTLAETLQCLSHVADRDRAGTQTETAAVGPECARGKHQAVCKSRSVRRTRALASDVGRVGDTCVD